MNNTRHTTRHTLTALITLLSALICAAPMTAVAQIIEINEITSSPVLHGPPADRESFHAYIGGQLMGIGALAQSAAADERYLSRFGGGIGLWAGLRLNPVVSLEGNWTFALHDEAGGEEKLDSIYIMTATADLKAHLPTASPLEPFAQVGGGLLVSGGIYLDERNPELPDTVFSLGAAFNAGVGLEIWVTRHITMGARVLYRCLALGEQREERSERFRNVIHGISVDAQASIHF
jgi:Outer membrane protein beta-barrel domain